MTISAMFFRGDDWESDLIAWGTKRKNQLSEDCPSHVGFKFSINGTNTVIESDIKDGVQLASVEESMEDNILLHDIDLGYSEEETYRIFEKCKTEYVGKWYDVFGLVYLGWRVALFKFFKTPIPTKNKWGFKKMYFCSEFYSAIVGGKPQEYGMASPNDLMFLLIDNEPNTPDTALTD